MSHRMQLRKRSGPASTLVPSKRRRSLAKVCESSAAGNRTQLPTENVLDVFRALDRASLETLQLVCRRYRNLIDSALADVCLREIREGSIRLGADSVTALGRRRKCSGSFYSAGIIVQFSDSVSKGIQRSAAYLRHSVVAEVRIENVDGAYAFELAKQLALNCQNISIVGALRMSNLKTLAHFRPESILEAFGEVAAVDLSFDEPHHTNCDSLLRYCAQAGIYDVQVSQLFQDGRFGAIRPALSEDAVIAYCLQKGPEKRELCVPGHAFSKSFFKTLVERSLACTVPWECKLLATSITPQATTDFAEFERETSDAHRSFEFADAAMPFSVLFELRGDDVDLIFARL
ncbi:hypothetical protein AAVH_25473 [Aphelenchoides avenae]|nr:hypothetical protein AAVH_25473 [Aphelenchus avenae]